MNGKYTALGLIVGVLLTLAALTGGFGGFLLAAVLGGVGAAIGAHLDGKIDLTALGRRTGSRR